MPLEMGVGPQGNQNGKLREGVSVKLRHGRLGLLPALLLPALLLPAAVEAPAQGSVLAAPVPL
jgi:hypothetical protein